MYRTDIDWGGVCIFQSRGAKCRIYGCADALCIDIWNAVQKQSEGDKGKFGGNVVRKVKGETHDAGDNRSDHEYSR